MADEERGLRGVLQKHAVALISLCVALFSTSYNTWRNETTEAHRNVRQAAFSMLSTVGEFQQTVDRRYWGGDRSDANRIRAWGAVSLLRDLGPLVSGDTRARADALHARWSADLDALDAGERPAEERIAQATAELRTQLIADLVALQ
ncbi:MAG: hypothetical protein IPK27_10225 [Rhodanobacteraceae bacterium]|nr:hypothetical protein [Rhodanobacteraceae bacterium]